MAMGKTRKGKRKFERIRKRYKLCKEEMDVTEEVNCETATVNKGFVRRYVYVLQLLQLKDADIF